MSFFEFWVINLWGNSLLSLFGTGALFSLIGILGRVSYPLLITLLALYFITFGVAFYGIAIYLPLFLFSAIYFGIQLNKFLTRE